ncbi:tetratricopeptide repeat protein [Vulcanococcus limneticus]|uniref:tetratricopeptide repeat protein n=1 Tax=Vulcanococcus limneticus TaxID=2170428 RepID=UPI00398BE549
MGKPKRSSSGFSKAKPSEAPKQQVAKGAAGAGAKEQQAIALINQGKPEEAEAIYRELIEAGTRNHAVYCNLAAICESKGKIKAAIEYLQISVGLSQGNPEAHYRIGKLHKTAGNYSQAISSYQTALLSNKNDHRVLNSLGIALRLNGDPEQAALFIKQAPGACRA